MNISKDSIVEISVEPDNAEVKLFFINAKINNSYYFLPIYKSLFFMSYDDTHGDNITNDKLYVKLSSINKFKVKYIDDQGVEREIEIETDRGHEEVIISPRELNLYSDVKVYSLEFLNENISECTLFTETEDDNGNIHILKYYRK